MVLVQNHLTILHSYFKIVRREVGSGNKDRGGEIQKLGRTANTPPTESLARSDSLAPTIKKRGGCVPP